MLRDPVVRAAALVAGAWTVFAWLTWRPYTWGPEKRAAAGDGTWTRVDGAELLAKEGGEYRAAISVPWYVPNALLTDTKIRDAAAARGFHVTWIGRSPPSWSNDGDLWVEATATRTIAFDRPDALVGAWVRSSS